MSGAWAIAERTRFADGLAASRRADAASVRLVGVVLISNLPISLTGGLVPPPLLGLMPVYFWCLVRPDLMTPAAVFAIGVLQDMLSGGPPGVWTAVLRRRPMP